MLISIYEIAYGKINSYHICISFIVGNKLNISKTFYIIQVLQLYAWTLIFFKLSDKNSNIFFHSFRLTVAIAQSNFECLFQDLISTSNCGK